MLGEVGQQVARVEEANLVKIERDSFIFVRQSYVAKAAAKP